MQNKTLTDIYKWVWVVLIILAVFLGIQTLSALKGLRNSDPSYNSISVSGEGEAFAVPDLATFSFTVSADADTVSLAQEEVTKKIDAVVEALESLGIEEKDIKTTDYSVWPRYSYASMPCSPSYNVSVKVRKTEDAGKALAAAGDKGATGMSSVSFTVDDPEKITNEAREEAIAQAKEKAETLADQLGVRLVRVVSYSDNSDGGIMPYYREGVGMGGVTVAQDVKAPTIPTGENKVRVVVNVTYEIR